MIKRILYSAAYVCLLGIACDKSTINKTNNTVKPITISAEAAKMLSDFSFDFFKKLQTDENIKTNDNIFVSPLSLHIAFAMVSNGANEATKTEILSAMKAGNMTVEDLNQLYKQLLAQLPEADKMVILKLANAIFYKNNFAIKENFLAANKNFYNAEVTPLPFIPADAAIINNWANKHTNGKITEVIKQIYPQDIMYLLNAIYFKGDWQQKFDVKKTTDETFTGEDGTRRTVKMMHARDNFAFHTQKDFNMLIKPYGNSQFEAIFILPNEGKKIADVMQNLNNEVWKIASAKPITGTIDFSLPRFTFSTEYKLNNTMKKMGVLRAFENDADFSNLSNSNIKISLVKQNTYVGIDEAGTEAAAVTTIGMTLTAAVEIPVFACNRPFGFLIREKTSGLILFMGKVMHP